MKHCVTHLLSLLTVTLLAPAAIGAHATDLVPRNESYPWMSLAKWYRFHADDVEVAEKGQTDLLFVGDSITEGWAGQPTWDEAFGEFNPANFGIGGDTTSNVLWRLKHGAVGKLSPKVIVLLIGTNNFWFNKDNSDDVVEGIAAVIKLLRESFPNSKILVLEIFPRDELPTGESRLKVEDVNKHLPSMADNEHVFVQDLGGVFFEADGKISKTIMPDYLHLSPEGYQRWAKAILPTITPWLKATEGQSVN
jgi:lysophospholipase L1-like esterase